MALPVSSARIRVVAALLGLMAFNAAAQTLTSDQIQAYKSLSPDQQQALKQQLESQLGGVTGNSGSTAQPRQLSTPVTVVPRDLNYSTSTANANAAAITASPTAGAATAPALSMMPPAEEDGELVQAPTNQAALDEAPEDPLALTSQRPPPYGYDLFAGTPTTFAPATDIPVPVDYVMGPGDTVNVQLFGKTSATYSLLVGRDGTIQFPDIGPISVAGLTFDQMRGVIDQRVSKTMIGVQSSITLGALRSMRVFVLGDAYRPGGYTVSALSTITNALFVSGGIKQTGSLRNIELKRRGRLITRLDLYDLLLNGDTSDDQRLMPGDVVFIPPVGKRVSIDGEVVRPATYEFKGKTTVADLLRLAGGALPTAYLQSVSLERIRGGIGRTVDTLDLSAASGRKSAVDDGDFLHVDSVLDRADNVVLIMGNVDRPGLRQWRNGMRLSDAISDLSQLKPRTDPGMVLIRREIGPSRHVQILSGNLTNALALRGSENDPLLQSRDRIYVFPADGDRTALLQPLVDELKAQASAAQEAQLIQIDGSVKSPGVYPFVPTMSAHDLVLLAGGFAENAYTREVEVVRRNVEDGAKRETRRYVLDMQQPDTANGASALQPYDIVHVRPVEGWTDLEYVTISGEVRFPGSYAIAPNEDMRSVIARAGGLTEFAYIPGAVFTRESVRQAQQEALAQESQRLRNELAQVQIEATRDVTTQAADAAKAAQIGTLLAKELESAQAKGRIVVDMQAVMKGKVQINLRGGDTLSIPRRPSSVSVLGEVQYPTSHLFNASLDPGDYIESSGGFTGRADEKHAYVIHYNGQVVALRKLDQVLPGDTIIVPFDAERIPKLSLWSTISEIVSRLAITAASFKTIGVF